MKIIDLLILLLSLLIIGCSSTYKISNFPSKDKFYEDFNKFAKDKSVKVTLVNDSSFYVENGAQIKNDTIYSFGQEIITRNKKIPSSDTVEINYTDSNPVSAEILLNDGEKYQANQIEFLGDSIYFSYDNKIGTINKISSLDKLKCISYRNHWLGIPFGFLDGLVIGTGAGIIYSKSMSDQAGKDTDSISPYYYWNNVWAYCWQYYWLDYRMELYL